MYVYILYIYICVHIYMCVYIYMIYMCEYYYYYYYYYHHHHHHHLLLLLLLFLLLFLLLMSNVFCSNHVTDKITSNSICCPNGPNRLGILLLREDIMYHKYSTTGHMILLRRIYSTAFLHSFRVSGGCDTIG